MDVRVPETHFKDEGLAFFAGLVFKTSQMQCRLLHTTSDSYVWNTGIDVVREFTWAEWAIGTPGYQVKLSGDILESICTSPTALLYYSRLFKKLQGNWP